MTWIIVNASDSTQVGTEVYDTEPELAEGQRLVETVLGFPQSAAWVPTANKGAGGFADLLTTVSRNITIGEYKALFTQAERIAIHAASLTNPAVWDYLDVLNGYTNGITLDNAVITSGLAYLVSVGLLTAGRATQIQSGTSPT